MLCASLLLLAAFFYTSPALAAWGEPWGVMVWGAAPSAVPSMDGLGLGLLVLILIGLAIRGLRSRSTLGLVMLASFVGAADLAEAEVTIPNTFTNGEVAEAAEVNANFSALADALDVTVPNSFANSGIADADEVNSNFTALKTAVDTFTNDLAAAKSATDTAFANGSIQGAASVDITTDNTAVCTTAGGTYDAGTDSCSVDITTDNAAVCTTAGGTYDAGTDSCAVDITTDNAAAEAVAAAAAGSAACAQAGGTWDAGTSTCTPAAAAPDPDLGSLHPGDGSNCWLSGAGGIWCWGDNDYGKFGNGSEDNVYEVPVQPIGMESGVVSMEAGEDFHCAITDEARLFCWGRGSDGQLGYGGELKQSSPVEVVNEDGTGWLQVSAGDYHACGVTGDKIARCWGSGSSGRLGNGGTEDEVYPVDVVGLDDSIVAVAAGGSGSCAATEEGQLFCWGDSDTLGNGSEENSLLPVAVPGLEAGVVEVGVSGSGNLACALTDVGEVWCWGDGERLGQGNEEDSLVPVQVSGLSTGVASLSVGSGYSCAVLEDESAVCWGDNNDGNLGDGTTTDALLPVAVSGLSGVSRIWAGENRTTCAVGEILSEVRYCWGRNYYGEVGNGLGERGGDDVLTPTHVSILDGLD